MKLFHVCLALVAFLGLYAAVGTVESTDRIQAEVLDVLDNEIIIQDTHGYLYSFYGSGYSSGQWLEVTFFNGGDTNPCNDRIIAAKPIN